MKRARIAVAVKRAGIGFALTWIAAHAAPASVLTHQGLTSTTRVLQTVETVDAWSDGPGSAVLSRPADVLTRVVETSAANETVTVHLLLFGRWGAQHFSFEERRVVVGSVRSHGVHATWRAVDLDGDGQNEIAFITAELETVRAVDEAGEPLSGEGPRMESLRVALRALARRDDTLVEREIPASADDPGFSVLAGLELGGPTNALLQLAAGDVLHAAGEYEKARYRWRIVQEWAEGALTGQELGRLSQHAVLLTPEAIDPVTLWLAAVKRRETLPVWYLTHDRP